MDDVTPVSVNKMRVHHEQFKRGGTADNTICCTIAYVHENINDENLKFQLRRAVAMAKRMSKKLQEYKNNVNSANSS